MTGLVTDVEVFVVDPDPVVVEVLFEVSVPFRVPVVETTVVAEPVPAMLLKLLSELTRSNT